MVVFGIAALNPPTGTAASTAYSTDCDAPLNTDSKKVFIPRAKDGSRINAVRVVRTKFAGENNFFCLQFKTNGKMVNMAGGVSSFRYENGKCTDNIGGNGGGYGRTQGSARTYRTLEDTCSKWFVQVRKVGSKKTFTTRGTSVNR